jgi:WD40 repeat protein
MHSPFDASASPDQVAPEHADAVSPTFIRYFGDYEITSEIARGGMGVVFRARQMSLNRAVALKMILAGQLANETEVRRFYSEAEAAANLDHPGIVPIFEVGQHEGQHYFSMGFVEGQSVSQRLAAGPFPPREAAALLARVADAIEYAHQRGVIHRDLKPANILIDQSGSPRVTDFGLAKKLQSDSALTGSGQIMGTPSYMPPEQAGGERGEVGPAADVYALGATLYALVTGRPPFQAATAMDTVIQVLSDEPVPPRRLNVSVPVDLETICLKCLQKQPAKRYASAADFAADLRRFLAHEPIVARPVTPFERAAKWVRRRPTVAALVGLVALVSALGLGGVLWQWRAAVAARIVADARRHDAERARQSEAAAHKASDEARAALNVEKENAVAKLYTTSIALAHQEWLTGDVARAEELLDTCPSRLRQWEWHYLRALCHSELLTLRGDQVATVAAFTADGRHVVSADLRGDFILWDVATGAVVRSIRANEAAVAFDPKRQILAAITPLRPSSLSLWSLTSTLPISSLSPSGPFSERVAFSPDGKTLALIVNSSQVRLWDIDRNAEVARLKGRGEPVKSFAFSPDGRLLGVGKDHGWFEVWEIGSAREPVALRGHPTRDAAVQSVAFSPDGKRLATASIDGTAKLWSVHERRLLTVFRGHRGFLLDVAFRPDGRLLATAGYDHNVWLWDTVTGQNVAILRGHAGMVTSVAFSPDGRRILTRSTDKTLKLWEVRPGETSEAGASSSASAEPPREPPQRTIAGRAAAVAALAFHPKAPRLASVDWDGLLRVDDLVTGRALLSVRVPSDDQKSPHSGTPLTDTSLGAVAYSPDGKLLAVGTGGMTSEVQGVVYLLDAVTGRTLRRTETLRGPTSVLAFSLDGRRLLIGTGNLRGLAGTAPTAAVFDAANGARIATYEGHTAAVLDGALSRDGALAATTGFDGTVRIWGSSDGKERRRLGEGTVFRGLAFSPDDTLLAAGGMDGSLWVYHFRDDKPPQRLRGHTGQIYRVGFSPDGKRLASAEAELKLWDVSSGAELLTPRDTSGELYDVEFSPDGRRLATAGFDGTIFVRSAGQPLGPSTDEWPVIFRDRFDRAELGDRWKILSGHWSIEGGAARGVLGQIPAFWRTAFAATLVPRELHMPRTVEVRFECWAPQPIAVEAKLHDVDRFDPMNGVGMLFPGLLTVLNPDRLATSIIVLNGGSWETVRSNPRFILERDTHYRFRIMREPARLTVSLGEEEVITSPVPDIDVPVLHLQGVHGSGGETVYIDNVEVRAPAAETAAERAALARVGELFARGMLAADVSARVRDDPALDSAARELAVGMAARREKYAQLLNNRGYLVAFEPGHTPAQYESALRHLEEAHRLVPGDGSLLDSLGVGQLRVGRDRDALDSLARADRIMRTALKNSFPSNLAFQAIAQARLGNRDAAEVLLDRVGELATSPVWGMDGVAGRVRDQAQAALKSTAATDREATVRNLQAVGRAIEEYTRDKKVLPPPAIIATDGKRLLSWRVALLPFLGETHLYNQFRRDEPWDSPHNRLLLAKIPACYKPGAGKPAGSGMTYVRAFVGPGTVFDGREGLPVGKITDGTVATVVAAEAAESVPWTEPADLDFAADTPRPVLGSLPTGRASLLFADGVVLTVDRTRLKPEQLRALITRAGGETIDRSTLAP